ncbi:hypothetical protein GH5_07603 [Leishmania sp. Ghana 2012 LV757]|uniref:hypothetical protein n=1 Tax=Leishmania sp. Ghana 2012 LV757 TaxID=2803181 RepID=UPI001B4A1B51|nr:hypothetical protein GH5_07603 [Leishmania sp. Ghana 2012 LV757]
MTLKPTRKNAGLKKIATTAVVRQRRKGYQRWSGRCRRPHETRAACLCMAAGKTVFHRMFYHRGRDRLNMLGFGSAPDDCRLEVAEHGAGNDETDKVVSEVADAQVEAAGGGRVLSQHDQLPGSRARTPCVSYSSRQSVCPSATCRRG